MEPEEIKLTVLLIVGIVLFLTSILTIIFKKSLLAWLSGVGFIVVLIWFLFEAYKLAMSAMG